MVSQFARLTRVVLLLAALIAVGAYGSLPTAAQAVNSAQIVIRFEDGSVLSKRVVFSEPSISGLEALRRTGLTLEEDSGAVCRVDGTGCPATDCFCHAKDPAQPLLYWSYYHWQGNRWQYATTGATAYQVTNGAVEGWSWGDSTPTSDPVSATQAGLNYLRGQQQADGGYFNAGSTLDSLLAASAAYEDIEGWRKTGGKSMIEYLEANGATYAKTGAREMGKLALGLAAADLDPRNFVKQDLVISLTTTYDAATGAFGSSNWDQSFAMLGWVAAGETVPPTATLALETRRNSDGGWGFNAALASDADSTGLALQALVAAGTPVTSTAIISGVQYLRSLQQPDGGLPVEGAENTAAVTSNTNSTAFAVQGLVAAGVDPFKVTPALSSTTPISFVLGMQRPDGGFKYLPSDSASNLIATQQAVPALLGKPFPYQSRAVALRKALGLLKTLQLPGGDFAGFGDNDTGSTIDAVLAISAAGLDPQSFVSSAGKTPLDYFAAQGPAYAAKGAAAAGKLALGVVAAGGDARAIGGTDLVISMTNTYNSATGAFGTSSYDQIYGILGLVAAGQTVPISATRYLEQSASPAGGWGFGINDAFPDPDSTGLALQALAAAGVPKTQQAVQDGLAFLRKVQNADGGFPGFGGTTSANSTGLALQGIAAYGEDGRSLRWSVGGSDTTLTLRTPVEALLALQSPEGGFAGFGGPNDPSATYQAIGGIANVALPTRSVQLVYLPIVLK